MIETFPDAMSSVVPEDAPHPHRWFDRAYFNLSGGPESAMLALGLAKYPESDVSDGYVVFVHRGVQQNFRFSQPLSHDDSIGNFQWTIEKEFDTWRIWGAIEEHGLALDIRFHATTVPNFLVPIFVAHEEVESTRFAQFMQVGRYSGEIALDGERFDVEGWSGLRDRSRGVRNARDGIGLHTWGVFAVDDERHLSFNYNEHRDGSLSHMDGCVISSQGAGARVVDVKHDFKFDQHRELLEGTMKVVTENGETFDLGVVAASRGIYMSGAGYDGWHGQPRGTVLEHERWDTDDGDFEASSLTLGLMDKPCWLDCNGNRHFGMFEFALTRSPRYKYQPTMVGSAS